MTRTLRATTLALAAALGLAGAGARAQDKAPATYQADVIGANGRPIGRILIRDGTNALILRLAIEAGGLAPGWHGLHLHAVGDCSDPGAFERSGPILNHDGNRHGLLNPEGPNEGDLPNVLANADGSVNAEVSSDTPLNGEGSLRDSNGSALIVHAGEDDHVSQPIGNAGARVACAVIK